MPDFSSPSETAANIFVNGTIVTVDEHMSYAEAVAVNQRGKIIAVGSCGAVERWADDATKRIDLKGRALLPGFYDAHGHFDSAGINYRKLVNLTSPPVGRVLCMDQLVDALASRAKTTPPGEWVQGFGYNHNSLEEKRYPTRYDLDRGSREHPIMIKHFSGHNRVVNSFVLEMAGITSGTPDPAGGVIGRFPDGTPNGQFFGSGATALIAGFVPDGSRRDYLDAIAYCSDLYASAGITTANVGSRANYELYREALDKGYLKIRACLWFTLPEAKRVHKMLGGVKHPYKPIYPDEEGLLVVNGVKYFADGSPQLRTANLTDPYVDTGEYPPDWRGLAYMTRAQTRDAVVNAHEEGFDSIHIHGNGDAAIDNILDAYEEVRKPGYRKSSTLRHVVIHSQFQREDQMDRMAEMGVIPSFFILHPYYLGDRHIELQGVKRALRMSAAKDAVDRNMVFTFHCDTPVFPMDPLLMMWAGVNRLSYKGTSIYNKTYNPDCKYRSVDQRISPADALRAVTIHAAYQEFEENITGSIEIGKRADFVVLSDNPLEVDPMLIKDIRIMETMVGGKTVFKADDPAGKTVD